MTVREFCDGSEVDGVFSVSIRNHKMFKKLGPARVGFFVMNLQEAMTRYMNIFKSHVPDDKALFCTDGLGNK